MTQAFSCGHPRTDENSNSENRCKICGRARRRAYRRSDSPWFDNKHERSDEQLTEEMERSSRLFLRTLYQQHPYVFEAAKRSGRLAVVPK